MWAMASAIIVLVIAVVVLAVIVFVSNSDDSPDDTATTTTSASSTPADSRLDDTFIAQVRLIDEVGGSRSMLIEMGQNVCVGIKNGSRLEVLKILNDEYGIDAAAKFMHAAVSVYCPEELSVS